MSKQFKSSPSGARHGGPKLASEKFGGGGRMSVARWPRRSAAQARLEPPHGANDEHSGRHSIQPS